MSENIQLFSFFLIKYVIKCLKFEVGFVKPIKDIENLIVSKEGRIIRKRLV